MEPDYIGVLIQWLMLFALMSIMVVPAIIFRRIALRLNKKGWVYFLVGAGVGLISLQVARLLASQLVEHKILEAKESYMATFILFFIVPGIMVTTAIVAFKRGMARN